MPIRSLVVMEALAKWDDFPVDREPRPIVRSGMDIDGGLRDRYAPTADAAPSLLPVADHELPPELLASALAYCEGLQLPPGRRLEPLFRGDAPFGTDRGVQLLPAWIMFRDDGSSPFIAMDPRFEREHTWWPPGLRASTGTAASLAADGRTLAFPYYANTGYRYPGAKVHETATAVLIEPVRIRERETNFDLVSERFMHLRLDAPFGNRVLISPGHGHGHDDACGAPITVLREP